MTDIDNPTAVGDEPAALQIDRLAKFIIDKVPGEPSESEGAVDCAIRLLQQMVDERRSRGVRLPPPDDGDTVLQEAERVVNGPRRVEYGGVLESFEKIAAKWSVTLGVEVTAEQVGLCMIDLKTVRALQGWHRDSYVDIAGYARCVELMQDER